MEGKEDELGDEEWDDVKADLEVLESHIETIWSKRVIYRWLGCNIDLTSYFDV